MKILFFDCETTGKADFKAAAEAEHQPRIVQIAAILCDEKAKEVCAVNLVVWPVIEIPSEAAGIHGITTDFAKSHGVKLYPALTIFWSLAGLADLLCAHNVDFDSFIIDGETRRVGLDAWERPRFCTMKSMTDICQLPGPYGNKWPKLIEAYRHCFKKDFDGAHDALADVRACRDIYFWLQERNAMPEDTKTPA